METKEKQATVEIQIIRDKSLLTVTTIKKKYVDQMQKLPIEAMRVNLVEKFGNTLNAVGWYRDAPKDSTFTYESVILKIADYFFRVDIYVLCSHIVEQKNADLFRFRKNEKEDERKRRYEKQKDLQKVEVEKMMKFVPQLFTD